jgi:hypothetical protein
MQKQTRPLTMLTEGIRAEARQRHARWDDGVFERFVSWQTDYLWRALEKHPEAREGSIQSYLELVAAGIGAGYLARGEGPPRTLLEVFVGRMPVWLARSTPESHGGIAARAWNLAEGARREAPWIEQYLLARAGELDDPLVLEQKVLELLRPALEPKRAASWMGPFTVTVVDMSQPLPGFLPGELSVLTPSLIRIADRRRRASVGVLLAAGGQSACIGPMEGESAAAPLPAPGVAVAWAGDRVTVAGTTVALPLMAGEPLHTLALGNGYLIAVVRNSQRVWVVETP